MRIAILSDIHDNLWNLTAAVDFSRDADVMICCGDLCSPFVIDELARFPHDVHIVFGNNDADLYRITLKASKTPNCRLYGELFVTEFDGNRFAVNHFDYIARPLAKSRDFDVVCFGHNHELEVSAQDACLLINPGCIIGAKFTGGKREDTLPSFVIYDTVLNKPTVFFIDPQSKRISEKQ